ncbi:hypothetical protein CFN78_13530 [Amycolatopsis antarctica]|uniref:Uncharacterized protein n=1 Tax=Amycolatopsis antarctica TaxID=1854586 RepID=A0A263D2F3_9PSEU|nr:hypothetical protein [Amycolatopsis antarctica]OZM72652.1 hypothetical protein CFN78_13530 [Amycolatopsis antarctica]
MTSPPFDLLTTTKAFAQEVQDLLDAVFAVPAGADLAVRQIKVLSHGVYHAVRAGTLEKVGSIPLYAGEKPIASLLVNFRCEPDQTGEYLAVRKSEFSISSTLEGTPLLRCDFDQKAHSVPAAHWNVHAERGAVSVLLARNNRKHSGLLSEVHLPVGGSRFRPCLEDFLDMVVREFKLDTKPGCDGAIAAGRENWRVKQTRSAVRDSPAAAAEVLKKMGYAVTPPEGGHRSPNTDMLQCR